MKIDRTKLKKSSSEVPGDSAWLIEKLKTCTDEELLSALQSVESWNYGKCELYHWIDVLDRFDSILESAVKKEEDKWVLPCDLPENSHIQDVVVWVLHFTTLLVEHSFSRHLYSSVEHLITLLSSSSMRVVLAVLGLLYMFSKRSNFLPRLGEGPKKALFSRLMLLAESWGGKENGFGLAQCCCDVPLDSFPESPTTLHFEFYGEPITKGDNSSPSPAKTSNCSTITIQINNIQSLNKSPSQIMEEIMLSYKVPADKQMVLFTHLRLAHCFAVYETRLKCVQARLQALSVLVYCSALQDNANTVLYLGLLDEFVDILELNNPNLTEIKAATLKTLTAIIHLDRMPNFPKLGTIMDVTGASSYHGFLPVLVRSCISSLVSPDPAVPNPFPAPLATALFSFLYHLASYELGGEALVSCSMIESLLSVVNWRGTEPDHITFVTRAVRVIDLITNIDMHAFHSHSGLAMFIRRLEFEVDECRKEQPFVINTTAPLASSDSTEAEMGSAPEDSNPSLSPMDTAESSKDKAIAGPSTASPSPSENKDTEKVNLTCFPQRTALMKYMLNFVKKAIQDQGFSESMRHLMEGSLPASLKHIISNAEYYGPSLFLLATDVVTIYVFGEPSMLSSLQDNGITDVVIHALLIKEVPATREVLASLPNVFSALCLNSRGLRTFATCKPFERLFKVLLSPDYLPAMRRRRSPEAMGDTASTLGIAMDELMRHQPSLKSQAMSALVKLLEEVVLLGSDTHNVCLKASSKPEDNTSSNSSNMVHATTNGNFSDEDEEDDDDRDGGGGANAVTPLGGSRDDGQPAPAGETRAVPLVDYVLNVMKFVDTILGHNNTDDHCKEFVTQNGLTPLLGVLGLKNLPLDFPTSQACQSVAAVCKSILNLAHESGVLQKGLQSLLEKLEALAPLHEPLPAPGGSVLLRELASSANPIEAASSPEMTPLLHTLSSVHAYIMMLVHVCRTGQADIRQVSINQWGTELGIKVLAALTKLYTSLVWESTVLLALCSEEPLPAGCYYGKEDLEKIVPPTEEKGEESADCVAQGMETESVSTPATVASGSETASTSTAPEQRQNPTTPYQMRILKPLLSSASRLGKALSELFGLLVKLCAGSPLRQRRSQQIPSNAALSASARDVAAALANLLHAGLSWTPPPNSAIPKFHLSFLICSVRFTNPMLFDDKKMPYHVMLHYFNTCSGLKAFFNTFDWAITGGGNLSPSQSNSISAELPDGTGEFLDTWLFLLERLVNPQTILESPNTFLVKNPSNGQLFNPLKFLIHIQKVAFESMMKLWNKKPLKNYGARISEAVLNILCSIIKGESVIELHLEKEKQTSASSSTTPTVSTVPPLTAILSNSSTTITNTTPSAFPSSSSFLVNRLPEAMFMQAAFESSSSTTGQEPAAAIAPAPAPVAAATAVGPPAEVAPPVPLFESPAPPGAQPPTEERSDSSSDETERCVQSLMEMGFSRERSQEAVDRTQNLEQATEYLLSGSHAEILQLLDEPPHIDETFSEDDQVLQAIAMSLADAPQKAEKAPKPSTSQSPNLDDEPLSKAKLNEFTDQVLEGCLNQLDMQSQLVYKVCVLLTTCVTRNGTTWRDEMLHKIITEVSDQAKSLSTLDCESNVANHLCTSELANKFAIRMHLLTLLFEEMKTSCAKLMEKHSFINTLTGLLTVAQKALMESNWSASWSPSHRNKTEKDDKDGDKNDESPTPKWLAPSLLLLDLYEKLSIATKRRASVLEISNHAWKWYDSNSAKWCNYSPLNNATIDVAYWNGESNVRIINGRRKYIIHFDTMLQVNEESTNKRPIMIGLNESAIAKYRKDDPPKPESEGTEKKSDTGEGSSASAPEKMECDDNASNNLTTSRESTKTSTANPPSDVATVTVPQSGNILPFGPPATIPLSTSLLGMLPQLPLTINPSSSYSGIPSAMSDPLLPLNLASNVSMPSLPQYVSISQALQSTISISGSNQAPKLPAKEYKVEQVEAFNDDIRKSLVESCVGFMKLGVDPDTLHALMRLSLRVTRTWELACYFANLGGIKTLLKLTDSSNFFGVHNLASLLIRHVLEEPTTLKYTMEKVVRTYVNDITMNGAKELHYLLRFLGPAACRDPELFTEIAQQCLRIEINLSSKRNAATANNEDCVLMRSTALKNTNNVPIINVSDEPKEVIYDLLESLTKEGEDDAVPSSTNTPATPWTSSSNGPVAGNVGARRQLLLSRSSSANDMVVQESDEQSPMESDGGKLPNDASKTNEEVPKKRKPLMSKSIVCKLLAEFIRSYGGVAKLITEYQYMAGSSELITEDCTALAYMLDKLVCNKDGSGEKDSAPHVRTLIAAIAHCNHAPEAQTILVTEVKAALNRATSLPEGAEKHTRIQNLVGMIQTMMESCPSSVHPNSTALSSYNKQQQVAMNSMVKAMVRHRLVTDLARIPHSLDLSSPNMANTINAILKPLEFVAKIVNASCMVTISSNKKKSQQDDSRRVEGTETTNSEATRAQGDEEVEDTENTEHDVSGTGESLEQSSEARKNEDDTPVEEGDEGDLEEILDHLLEDGGGRGRNESTEIPVNVTFVLDHDGTMDTDQTLHDSQMVSRSESQFMEDEDHISHDRDGDDDDSASDSTSEEEREDDNDDDVEDEEEDDVDDDEDDEDEDEEEGSLIDERYEDLEDAFISLPRSRDQEDMFLMPSYQQYIDTIDTIIFGDRMTMPTHAPTHEDPSFVSSTPVPAGTAGVSNSIPAHPLFQYPRETPQTTNTNVRTNGRPNRSRGLFRFFSPQHRDVLQLGGIRDTAHLLMNSDVRWLPEDTDVFVDSLDTHAAGTSGTGTTVNGAGMVPSALTRWIEESKVLENDSIFDAVTLVKPKLVATLERHKEIELAEKEKKKKEENASKSQNPLTDTSTSIVTSLQGSSDSNLTDSTRASQDSTRPVTATNLIISLLESQLGTTVSVPLTTSAITPNMSGIFTQITPVASTRPSLSLQEPSVSSVPESGTTPGAISSAPSTPQSTLPTGLPHISSSILPRNSSAVSSWSLLSTSPTTRDNQSTASESVNPLVIVPTSNPNIVSEPSSLNLQNPTTQEERPMSVSPPEYPNSPFFLIEMPDFSRSTTSNIAQAAATTATTTASTPSDTTTVTSVVSVISSTIATTSTSSLQTETTPVEAGAAAAASAEAGPSGRSSEYADILGDIEIPEGVDPSFLAALPEEMRQEVIAEQLRLQRVRQRATESNQENSSATIGEVNPEFLAALPPSIQEEVLAQQRLEQQRQQAAAINPDDPVDNASFLQSLSQSLRQTILADLEDSQFSALPPELAQEAQTLRRQREERSRHVHEHVINRGRNSLSTILRNAGRLGRIGTQLMQSPSWSSWNVRTSTSGQQASSKSKGRQLLDHEAMTCLLVLLFVDEPKLNITRLHRTLRYLCHHAPTMDWVIKALLSIIKRCDVANTNAPRLPETDVGCMVLSTPDASGKSKKIFRADQPLSSTPVWRTETKVHSTSSWLSMSMDAALGCRANVFQIRRAPQSGKRNTSAPTTSVHIHHQASPLVCRHALDTLIYLARMFPGHFLPSKGKENEDNKSDSKKATCSNTGSSSSSKSSKSSAVDPTDFWELLAKLDSISVSRKGKGLPRSHSSSSTNLEDEMKITSLESSALGQLILLLSHPVIKRSQLLTDRLLRLLALVSLGLSPSGNTAKQPKVSVPPENVSSLENLLNLAIQVLTRKSCTEDGLDDATALLLHLSHGPPPARDLVLKLLLQGATTLGTTVASHIAALLEDLRKYNENNKLEDEVVIPQATAEPNKKGMLTDRFTMEKVIINGANNKVKRQCELQLPSMFALTSKISSQAFFLRTLKVIIQLRDAIRLAQAKKQIATEPNPAVATRQASAAEDSETRETTTTTSQANPPSADTPADATTTQEESTPENPPTETQEDSGTSPMVESPQSPQEEPSKETPSTKTESEAMDVDSEINSEPPIELASLSEELGLDHLWSTLSECLIELGETPDTHAVLVLQPTVEAFFQVHAAAASVDKKQKPTTSSESRETQLAHLHHDIAPLSPLPSSSSESSDKSGAKTSSSKANESAQNDAEKFLKFAETHRSVLNQILRQSTVHLADGPFNVLVDHARLLDFDIKRKYFRTELERADDGVRRGELPVHVKREHVFEDSFGELHRRSADEWKNRFCIVFEGEEGQDAGGLLREWYVIISREIFNPMYALFCTSPGDKVTYMINPSSHCNPNHLSYFKFVGRVIAKAIYDNKLLDCYFTRSFYKHILAKLVRVQDMESEDYTFYKSLIYLTEHHVDDLGYEQYFSTEVQEFGVTEVRDLKPNGRNIPVTEENKVEYIRLVCQMKMTGAIQKQLNAFLEGFYDIIPKRLISIFNEQELELLISGLPTIDIDDLRANTEYNQYVPTSLQIQWFWRALKSFDQADRAKLVQFVTGTSKVPLQGFSALEGMNGVQKFQIHRDDRSTDRLPSAHTCFNQLDLPVYETYDKLRHYLLQAIQECSEGFGFA